MVVAVDVVGVFAAVDVVGVVGVGVLAVLTLAGSGRERGGGAVDEETIVDCASSCGACLSRCSDSCMSGAGAGMEGGAIGLAEIAEEERGDIDLFFISERGAISIFFSTMQSSS